MSIRFGINIDAMFWLRDDSLPSIHDQYNDMWKFAKVLEEFGFSLNEWSPPAETPELSILNSAFNNDGPTTAALAIAKTMEKKNSIDRSIGVWNGINKEGGALFKTSYDIKHHPCIFEFGAKNIASTKSKDNIIKILSSIFEIWNPILIEVAPYHYYEKRVFEDKPGVGWMIYLPFVISSKNVPEASDLIPIYGIDKKQKGTIIVSINETFDINNPEHIKRANEIEIRLVDQDLLPKRMDFLKIK